MTRRRRGLRNIDGVRLAALERALRGGDPELIPQHAAEALGKTRAGLRLLFAVMAARNSPELREAAVYGLSWCRSKPPVRSLLLRVFEDPREGPRVRGQAAEGLGPYVQNQSPRRKLQRRHLRLVRALVRGLDDPSPDVRLWSIFALAHPQNAWLLPKLAEMANDQAMVPGWWTVRQEALWAANWIQGIDSDPQKL